MLSRLCAQPPLHRRSACSAALPSSRDALGPALPLACRARRVARPTTARPCRASGSSNAQETSSAAATGSAQAATAGEAPKEQKEQQQQQPESAAAPPSVEHEGPSFSDLGVDRLFLPGLARTKVEHPVEIQTSTIPEILAGHNVAMQSYTGSGKTLAYLLPTMTLAIQRAEALFKAGQQDVPVQLLIVAPSQELAMQIVRVAQGLLPEQHRRTVQQCIGGANPKYQQDALVMNKPIVVVGTPGRLSEFIRIGALRLHRCPLLVLDEADQLLAPNFSEDMNHIHQHCGKRLPPKEGSAPAADASASSSSSDSSSARGSDVGKPSESSGGGNDSSIGGGAAAAAVVGRGAPVVPLARQTVLVSATLSQSVLSRIKEWCPSPRFISQRSARTPALPAADAAAGRAAAAAPMPAWGWGIRGWDGPANELGPRTSGSAGGVEGEEGLVPTLPPQLRHLYVVVEQRHKADALRRCIHAMEVQRTLVFMNYQQRLRDTMFKLSARKIKCAALHGEMAKLSRTSLLHDFRRGRMRALIVSDVISRGLDVDGVDAVFNAELPSSAAHYAHRAGRTGRMGAPGTVVSLVTRSEVFVIEKLSRRLGVQIEEAHTRNGVLVMGPAPHSQRWDDDLDNAEDQQSSPSSASSSWASFKDRQSSATDRQSSATDRQSSGRDTRSGGRGQDREDVAKAPGRGGKGEAAGAAARSAGSTGGEDEEEGSRRGLGQGREQGQVASSSSGRGAPAVVRGRGKGGEVSGVSGQDRQEEPGWRGQRSQQGRARGGRAEEAKHEEEKEEEEEEAGAEEIDARKLDKWVGKRLRQGRRGGDGIGGAEGDDAAAPGGREMAGEVAEGLQRELEELRAEKEASGEQGRGRRPRRRQGQGQGAGRLGR